MRKMHITLGTKRETKNQAIIDSRLKAAEELRKRRQARNLRNQEHGGWKR